MINRHVRRSAIHVALLLATLLSVASCDRSATSAPSSAPAEGEAATTSDRMAPERGAADEADVADYVGEWVQTGVVRDDGSVMSLSALQEKMADSPLGGMVQPMRLAIREDGTARFTTYAPDLVGGDPLAPVPVSSEGLCTVVDGSLRLDTPEGEGLVIRLSETDNNLRVSITGADGSEEQMVLALTDDPTE